MLFILFPVSLYVLYKYKFYIKMFSKVVWYKFIHSILLNQFIKHEGNSVILSYIINGRLHKIVVDNKRGPNKILCITDENDNDVTDEIMVYDFENGIDLTPSFWNKKKLTFEFLHDKKTFLEYDIIKFEN